MQERVELILKFGKYEETHRYVAKPLFYRSIDGA